jgi:phosphoadenosine phosphosulfate reductase
MNDAVLAHLADRVAPGVPVVFVDTGYMHAETLGTRDAVATVHRVSVRTVRPLRSVAEQDRDLGADLFARDPDRCCALRKVAPLDAALADYLAWGTGLRRDETPQRAGTPVVAFDERRGKVKIAPIARWTAQDVDDYIAEHGVLVNPLVADGYPSVGCEPCTARPLPGADPRSGRWAGRAKTECGIHL